ncbi:MAG: AAA family ATPase [Anaerovoracaceae bacterium]|jgi:AAA15 family ATPase/GTPase
MYNFDDNIVRILEISLKNYKNISNGTIKMSDISNVENDIGDVLGIYGQNGSGKTSVISAIGIIKDIFSGKPLPEDIYEYIMYGKDEAEIDILFYIKDSNQRYKVRYNIIISKDDEKTFIKEESIHYWHKEDIDDDWDRVRGLIINVYDKNNIYPKYRNEELLKLYDDNSDFIVNKKMRFKNRESLIFSEELLKLISINPEKISKEYEILNILQHYASSNLFIIDNKELALSDANILLPMNFKNYRNNKCISMGVMPIGLDRPTYLPKEAVSEIETSIKASNKVISEIIPGLTIELKELKMQISKSGEEEVLVELLSCREDVEIPIRYESDGIKKIVAVLHLLIAMFNYNSMTVLIDELDSGIFEYLLGEILEILEQRGKGQLIFTSHNLRPLEVLDKNNLVFTTTNINNRYIKLKNVKTNNNLRDMYYRDLVLGGQDEVIYDSTNSAKIARAFRKAGE